MQTFKEYLITEATDDPRAVVKRGLEKMMRMDAPASDSKEDMEKHAKDRRVVDSFDMIEALEVVRKMFDEAKKTYTQKVQTDRGEVDTSKGHRRGEKTFDFLKDVKGAIESYYMAGRTEVEGTLKKRKYRALVMLVLNPLVNTFKDKSPEEVFNTYNDVIDNMIKFVKDSEIVPTADDAFVARKAVQREVRQAQNVKKAVDGIMKLRKKSQKKDK